MSPGDLAEDAATTPLPAPPLEIETPAEPVPTEPPVGNSSQLPPGEPPPVSPPPGGSQPPPKPPKPPGLREQVRRTIASARALISAHVVLARAELAVILDDVKQVAIQVGIAIALLLYIVLLVSVGTALFLGEWLFGSMGWGILHGTLFCVATAVALVLGALRISRRYLAGTLLAALVVGIAVGTILGLAWPNAAYTAIGESVFPTVDAGIRPLLVGLTLWGTILAFVGLLVGARAGGVGGALGGFVAGAVVGVLFGAFTAISFSLQVGIALGVTATLIAWPILASLALRNYDREALKLRFTPSASIAAAEESMAWARARMPGNKEDGA